MTGFLGLVRAEWTKLRSVPGWPLTLLAAAAVIVLISLVAASGSVFSGNEATPPVGPDGRAVDDRYHLTYRTLAGDGTITARVQAPAAAEGSDPVGDWSKAGLVLKASAAPGASYVALMLTPGHGTRMQTDFDSDWAGRPGREPRWLRLTRTGGTVLGEESADGTQWARVGTAALPAGGPVLAGLFVAPAVQSDVQRSFGVSAVRVKRLRATSRFEQVAVAPQAGDWTSVDLAPAVAGSTERSGEAFTLSGSGALGPKGTDMDLVQRALSGALIGLVPIVALAVLFVTSEYRRGLARTTFTVTPRRWRVLAAKSLVIGAATFLTVLAAVLAVFPVAVDLMVGNGFTAPLFEVPSLADPAALRAVLGTAAALALLAAFSLALAVVLRRTAATITLVLMLILLPTLLGSALPLPVVEPIMSLTPVAGLAVQQTATTYPHAPMPCLPEGGCFPVGPWTGLGVLAAWTAAALVLAALVLRRRDV